MGSTAHLLDEEGRPPGASSCRSRWPQNRAGCSGQQLAPTDAVIRSSHPLRSRMANSLDSRSRCGRWSAPGFARPGPARPKAFLQPPWQHASRDALHRSLRPGERHRHPLHGLSLDVNACADQSPHARRALQRSCRMPRPAESGESAATKALLRGSPRESFLVWITRWMSSITKSPPTFKAPAVKTSPGTDRKRMRAVDRGRCPRAAAWRVGGSPLNARTPPRGAWRQCRAPGRTHGSPSNSAAAGVIAMCRETLACSRIKC